MRLAPEVLVLSTKSSPSNKQSFRGLIRDYVNLKEDNKLELVTKYLDQVKLNGFNILAFSLRLRNLNQLAETAKSLNVPLSEKSLGVFQNGHSQFALKYEAAGKLRIFALVDSITQSVLKPLHDSLYDLLKLIPNDGTFDQDKSVQRSSEKSIKYKCAYSFDLTAATDRLPSVLTASLFDNIFQVKEKGLGAAWRSLLVDRDYRHTDKNLKDNHKLPTGPIRYSVGQPMGGLSS